MLLDHAVNVSQMVDEPYPGLRPFRRDESHIFFGRETTINEMLNRLAAHHFLAITGASGSGKSSLVRTGLRDALDRGLMVSAGSDWRVAELRPGRCPLAALATALVEGIETSPSQQDPRQLEALLARDANGLVEWIENSDLSPQSNLLIVVDQFEEIFDSRCGQPTDEIDAFVAVLLASARQRQRPVYVAITVRSDCLRDTAHFAGLAEAINEGQFLTPRLTREQCREAIVGPAAVFGGLVEMALINRLLNDMGTNTDQLPLVQHVLMRLWRSAGARTGGGQPVLRLADYEALGGTGSTQPAVAQPRLSYSRPNRPTCDRRHNHTSRRLALSPA
jgi:hypothetical protein